MNRNSPYAPVLSILLFYLVIIIGCILLAVILAYGMRIQ